MSSQPAASANAASASAVDTDQQKEDLFQKADALLFKEKKFSDAEQLYRKIIEIDPKSIDALNSLAYCLKFNAPKVDADLFKQLVQIYETVLRLDNADVEANFNLGLLTMTHSPHSQKALGYFEMCCSQNNEDTIKMFRSQFAKAHFNLAVLHDQLKQVAESEQSYLKAISICQNDPKGKLQKSVTLRKASANLAVVMERMGKRTEAHQHLLKLKEQGESRVFNNLAIIERRMGDTQAAIANYKKSIQIDSKNFYPVYNLAILLKQTKDLSYVDHLVTALKLANSEAHKIGVLLHLAIFYEGQSDLEKAIDHYEQALAHEPGNLQIQQKLKHLKENGCDKREIDNVQKSIDVKQDSTHLAKQAPMSSRLDSSRRGSTQQQHKPVDENNGSQVESQNQVDVETKKKLDEMVVEDPQKEKKESIQITAAAAEEVTCIEEAKETPVAVGSMNLTVAAAEEPKDDKSVTVAQDSIHSVDKPVVEEERSSAYGTGAQSKARSSQRYAGWLTWSREVAVERKASDDVDEKKRAMFRLGQIEFDDGHAEQALECFKQCQQLDQHFTPEIVNVRIAELCYKLNQVDKALIALEACRSVIQEKDMYAMHLLRGKCLDRTKDFQGAAQEYHKAILSSIGLSIDGSIRGNLEFRLGWSIVRSRKIEQQAEGIQHLETAAELIPDNIEVLSKLSTAILQDDAGVKTGEQKKDQSVQADMKQFYGLCEKSLNSILKLDPKNTEASFMLGKLLFRQEKPKMAIKTLQNSLDMENQTATYSDALKAEVHYYIGLCQDLLKDYKPAMLSLKKCLTLEANNLNAALKLADLLAQLQEGQRAAKYYKHCLKIDPDCIIAQYSLGRVYQQMSAADRTIMASAVACYEEVLKQDPSHYRAMTQLGSLYLDQEQFEKSAEFLRKALVANKQFPAALIAMGNLLFETGNAEQAIKYHLQALKISDNELQALIGLGNAYYDTGAPDQAITFYRKALKQDSMLSDVHYNLGNALYLNEQIPQAVKHYREAIRLNPNKPESYYNLGNALSVQEKYKESISVYQKAVELDPTNAPAFYNLGNALYMIEKFKEAVDVYCKALEINPNSAECHFNLASAYNDLEDSDKAVKHFEECVKLDESNTDAYIQIGTIWESVKGKEKDAQAIYEKVLEGDAGNTRAIEGLARLKTKQNFI